jgi:hypothetical protein
MLWFGPCGAEEPSGLLGRLGGQEFHGRDVLNEFLREPMAGLEIGGGVVGEPDLAGVIFPD